MKHTSIAFKLLSTALGIAAISTPAFAVFPFPLESDATGNILGGSWSGDGTIQPNVVPGASGPTVAEPGGTASNNAPKILVEDFSGTGVLTIDNMGSGVLPGGSAARILTPTLSALHTITLTGGTADLRLHNSNSNDFGRYLHNSVGLTGFSAGVTSISWTLRWSEFLGGRDGVVTDLLNRPLGSGLALVNAGPGQDISSFTVGLNYNEIYQENAGVFTPGVPSVATPLVNPGFNAPAPGATSFTSDTFNALNEFLLVRTYNFDGVGSVENADFPKTYMKEMTWTITPDAGQAFLPGTIIVMSMDGRQYPNYVNVVPEPTSVVLLISSCLGACLIRRRSA